MAGSRQGADLSLPHTKNTSSKLTYMHTACGRDTKEHLGRTTVMIIVHKVPFFFFPALDPYSNSQSTRLTGMISPSSNFLPRVSDLRFQTKTNMVTY